MTTLLTEEASTEVDADVAGDDLWLEPAALAQATGWTLKPEGLCRGSICVPVPRGREARLTRADGRVNLAALARHLGQALVHDDSGDVWALDAGSIARASTRTSLEAPDFTLPDASGRLHSLHQHRGRKVLIASWASW